METENKKNTTAIIVILIVLVAVVVGLILFLTRSDDTKEPADDAQPTSGNVSEEDVTAAPAPTPAPIPVAPITDSKPAPAADPESPAKPAPAPAVEPDKSTAGVLPPNWNDLTPQEKASLNPLGCNVETEWVRADNGQCTPKTEGSDAELARQASNQFDDINETNFAASAIGYLTSNGLLFGCDDDNFCPDRPISRSDVILALWRTKEAPNPAQLGSAVFNDVPESSGANRAIGWAFEKSITQGCSEDAFCPNQEASRGQVAVLLYRYAGSPDKIEPRTFTDVDAESHSATAISWLANLGITDGCGENLFCPAESITRAQFAVFIYRIISLP